MINLIELNRQRRYIEKKQALQTLKIEIVEAITDSIKDIQNIKKGGQNEQ